MPFFTKLVLLIGAHLLMVSGCLHSASLLYQIGIRSTFDYGVFVFNQLVCHVASYAIKLPISLPRLFSNILLSQYPTILGPKDAPGLYPTVLNLNFKLFQGSHVPDIVHNICLQHFADIPLPNNL